MKKNAMHYDKRKYYQSVNNIIIEHTILIFKQYIWH